MHEMTTWYKCKLCHLSFVDHESINDHLRVTHHTNEKKFEKIIDEKEIEALRRSRTENHMKRRRDKLNLLKIERDTKTGRRDSSVLENNTPLEKWQYKPRTNKYVCQYCGYHSRVVGNVNNHVNFMHEMTTWYKCKLCRKSCLGRLAAYSHLRIVHQTKEKKFEVISDEKEIDALRISRAENLMKKRKDRLNLLMIEKDAVTDSRDSLILENTTPLERSQFKPRISKHTCQYCGYHVKNSSEVEKHVNLTHEMITWFQCKLCHCSFLGHQKIYNHLRKEHHVGGSKFELIKDEKKIEALRKLMAEKRIPGGRVDSKILQTEKDAETGNSHIAKNSRCQGALEDDISFNAGDDRSMTSVGKGCPVVKSHGTSNNDFTDIDVSDNKATKMKSIKEGMLEIEEHSLEPYKVGTSTQTAENSTSQEALEDDLGYSSVGNRSMNVSGQHRPDVKSLGTTSKDFNDIDAMYNKAIKMENIDRDILEIEEHPVELYDAEASTQNLDHLDEKWLVGPT